jgi:hyperosmotically inducible periplasmic protein
MKTLILSIVCVLVIVTALVVAVAVPGQARTVGQLIDDATIVATVKAKLTADQLSNLTKIDVKADRGIVTLGGTVDSLERRARAVQIASGVDGVKGIVNDIQVTGSGAPVATVPAPPAPPASVPSSAAAPIPSEGSVDATGTIARVDPATGTITLTDGRVLKATPQTVVWQPSTVQALAPGGQVLVRGAAPAGFQPPTTTYSREWRMGTISRVDPGGNQIVLTDGTVVRVTPATILQRGSDRISLDQLQPGSEVVVRTSPVVGATPVEATQIDIVWVPTASIR